MSCAQTTCAHKAPSPIITLRSHNARDFDWLWPDWFRDIAPSVSRMWERRQQRQALIGLDDHMLRDIGITRDEAKREARKPFWR